MGYVDLHIHTCYSDGTDSLEELQEKLRKKGISFFSVTDHDTIDGSLEILKRPPEGIGFIPGAEFSCKSPSGKCHILGYGYDPRNEKLQETLQEGKRRRRKKLEIRLEFLKERHGIVFGPEALERFYSAGSVGKPHLAQELVKMGYGTSITDAIQTYLRGCGTSDDRLDAGKVIHAVLDAGGLPVWAHPLGGIGERRLTEEEFRTQLGELMDAGIRGLECWYSLYKEEEVRLLSRAAGEHGLYVSGGSDYHGARKAVELGDLGCGGSMRTEEEGILTVLTWMRQRIAGER